MKNGNESLIRKWKLRSIQKLERNSRNITKIGKQRNNQKKKAVSKTPTENSTIEFISLLRALPYLHHIFT